jgi:cobyric acid synthase
MAIEITYTDTTSNAILRKTILDDDEIKAFEFVAYDVKDWIDNCFQNRARQAIDEVVGEALGDNSDVVLSDLDKTNLASKIGIVVKAKQIPILLKKEIVRKATFESVKEKTDKQTS